MVSTFLGMLNFSHTVMKGTATFDGQGAIDHYWVEAGDHIIDFRLREALSNNNAPDGMFPLAGSGVAYDGAEEAQTPLTPAEMETQLSKTA